MILEFYNVSKCDIALAKLLNIHNLPQCYGYACFEYLTNY